MRNVLTAVFLLLCSLEGTEVERVLQSIPSKDLKKIEFLFSDLVQCQNLGFVLFGNTKTAALCTIPIACNYAIVPQSVTANPLQYQKNLRDAWAVWERYQNRFEHPNIIVCQEYEYSRTSAFLQLIFIDKRKLVTLLDEYQDVFAEILGPNFSSTIFIEQIEKKGKIRSLIGNDEKLFGLLLGFGLESSAGFKNMITAKKEVPLTIAGYKPKGNCIIPVSFRGNPESKEVQALVDGYTREIHEIERIFRGNSFLVETLEKFCAP